MIHRLNPKNYLLRLFVSLNFIRKANNLCDFCNQFANFLICESVAIPFFVQMPK